MTFDFAFVRLWVEFAKQDARVALLIVERQRENAQFALYHVQQSIEKANKALLLLTGNPKYDMDYLRKTLSHDSLKASLEFIRINAEIEALKPYVKQSVKGDVYARLDEVIGKSRAYSDDLAWLPPHIVAVFLKLTGQLAPGKLLADIIPDHPLKLTQDQMEEHGLLELLMSHFNLKGYEKNTEAFRPLLQKTVEEMESYILPQLRSDGVFEINAQQFRESLDKDKQVMFRFMFVRLVVGLYVMSALTSSHEATTRYPFAPGANRQYDASVGVIFLIEDLAKESDRIATDFLEHFDEIAERIRTLHESYSNEEEPPGSQEATEKG